MSSIADQLKNINVMQLKMSNGMTYEEVLKSETKRLKKCIIDELQNYYNTYDPVYLQYRTENLLDALELDDNVRISGVGNTLSVYLNFNHDMSYNPSILGGDEGYTPYLLNYGWKWENQPSTPIYRFSYFDGIHFLENARKKFEEQNPYGIKVNIESY